MGRVKELLLERPFNAEQESVYNLAKRLLVGVDVELEMTGIPEEHERDLVRLRTALKEVIEYENTDSRVQQSQVSMVS